MDNYLDLLKLVLPQFLVEHFDLIRSRKEKEVLHLYFEERNTPPQEHSSKLLASKCLHKEDTIQDFPLRGNKNTDEVLLFLFYFLSSQNAPQGSVAIQALVNPCNYPPLVFLQISSFTSNPPQLLRLILYNRVKK